MTRYGKSIILMLIHVDKSTFPFMQDPGHFPHNRTNTNCHCAPLTVCSEHEQTEKKKRDKSKDSECEKAEEKKNGVSLTVLLGILFELHVYSLHSAVCDTSPLILSLPLPLPHSLSLHPRTAFQTKARGKIPAPKFRCCSQ